MNQKIKNTLGLVILLGLTQIPLVLGLLKTDLRFKMDITEICESNPDPIFKHIKKDRFFVDQSVDLTPEPEPLFIDVITEKIKSLTGLDGSKQEDYERRIAQAKELLGKYYKGSVVRKGENVKAVRDFVKAQVKQLVTHKNWTKHHGKISKAILKESKKNGFDPIFLMAVIHNESTFNPEIRGSFGEIGLMQIKPSTAEWIAKKAKIKYRGAKDLENPEKNIELGAAYLAYLRTRFKSHSRLYLSAYNMGTTNVNRALGKQIWPKDYASKVMNFYVKYYTELPGTTRLVSQN